MRIRITNVIHMKRDIDKITFKIEEKYPSEKIMKSNLNTSLEKAIQTMSLDSKMTKYFEKTKK